MYLVDTNTFLELLLSQAKKEECETFLQTIRNGKKTAIVTDFTIHSIIVAIAACFGAFIIFKKHPQFSKAK